MKHIQSIGIELEGAWNNLNFDQANSFKHDGSVSIESKRGKCLYNCICTCDDCMAKKLCCKNLKYSYVGEIPSPPFNTLKGLIKWTNDNYPDYTNRTCGLHVHIKTSINDYARLEDRAFYFYILQKLKEFGTEANLNPKSAFWDRLAGKCSHCKPNFHPEAQVNEGHNFGDNDRYTILNACYTQHGTYEIRVLPCFQKKRISLKVLSFLYYKIESYLDTPCKIESIKRIINKDQEYKKIVAEIILRKKIGFE